MWNWIKLLCQHYRKTFLLSVVFILLTTLIQNMHTFFPVTWLHSFPIRVMYWSSVGLFSLYCWVAVIYAAYITVTDQSGTIFPRMLRCAIMAFVRYPRVILYAALCMALFVVMMYWLRFLIYLGLRFPAFGDLQTVWNFILIGLPLLLLDLLFLLALPLLITTEQSFSKTLVESAHLCWRIALRPVFGLYVGMMLLWYLVFPGSGHAATLEMYGLKLVFDLLVYGLGMPLLANGMILLLPRAVIAKAV